MSWFATIFRFIVDVLRTLSARKREKREAEAAERARREDEARQAEGRISDAVDRVSQPRLDDSDPMGVDRWNRGG